MNDKLTYSFYDLFQDSIADVASIFAEIFCADLDVPPSDIAAGFVLLSKYQAAQQQWIVKNKQLEVEQYLSSIAITKDSNYLDISTSDDSHLINDLIYYMNYSLAIFGWPMHMFDDPCMLCCIYPYLNILRCSGHKVKNGTDKACEKDKKNEIVDDCGASKVEGEEKNSQNLSNKSNEQIKNDSKGVKRATKQSVTGELDEDFGVPIIMEDNCCGCNVASVERRLRAHNYEIIYVSYKVNVNVVPFLVAADHSKQSVVVAIRGSMSLSDVVTDMNGQTDKLPIDDCPDDWLSHRGMTTASSYIKSILLDEHILDRAFSCRPDLGSEDYNLVLCGHSLGAGVAAILGILLRKQYPTLKSYLYSPPGGMLSLPAVEYTKQFATGIILGNDCVSRLGFAQMERLRYHVLLSLKSSQKSTGKILAKALCPTCCTGGNKVDYDPNQSLNLLHGIEGRSFDYNGIKIPFQAQPQVLYVPGRLIHIVKNHTFQSKARRLFNEPIYQAVWTDNTIYDRIMISEGMFYDHLPTNLMHAMKMLFSKTLPARKDSKISVSANQEQEHHIAANGDINCNTQQSKGEGGEIIKEEIITDKDENRNYVYVIKDENNNEVDDNTDKLSIPNKNYETPTDRENTTLNEPIQDSVSGNKSLVDENGNDNTFINKNQ